MLFQLQQAALTISICLIHKCFELVHVIDICIDGFCFFLDIAVQMTSANCATTAVVFGFMAYCSYQWIEQM